MSDAAQSATRIQQALPHLKAGTLRCFGQWFGRPMDNYHTIVAASADANCLSIRFKEGELLRVWDPQGVVADERVFRIQTASRVVWQWYAYGRPKEAATLCQREYPPTAQELAVELC